MKAIILLLVFSQSFLIFSEGQVEENDVEHENWCQSRKIMDFLIAELKTINENNSAFVTTLEASEKHWDICIEEQFILKFTAYESWETRWEVYGS